MHAAPFQDKPERTRHYGARHGQATRKQEQKQAKDMPAVPDAGRAAGQVRGVRGHRGVREKAAAAVRRWRVRAAAPGRHAAAMIATAARRVTRIATRHTRRPPRPALAPLRVVPLPPTPQVTRSWAGDYEPRVCAGRWVPNLWLPDVLDGLAVTVTITAPLRTLVMA